MRVESARSGDRKSGAVCTHVRDRTERQAREDERKRLRPGRHERAYSHSHSLSAGAAAAAATAEPASVGALDGGVRLIGVAEAAAAGAAAALDPEAAVAVAVAVAAAMAALPSASIQVSWLLLLEAREELDSGGDGVGPSSVCGCSTATGATAAPSSRRECLTASGVVLVGSWAIVAAKPGARTAELGSDRPEG